MAAPSNLDQLKQWFQSYTLQQKVAIFGSAAGVVVLLWALVHYVNQVEYQILYSELEAEDAQSVIQSLESMSVEYQLSDSGATIRVPQEQLSRVRIQLASDGLPSSGRIGFEIFDRTNFGLTNFQEQVNFQRALEGELARSITTLSEVDVARVHLVLESDSLFQSDEDQTKASVILRLKQGGSISQASVNGIVHLVASSVKGLEPARVTVVDYAGRMLSRNDDPSPVSGQQTDRRTTIESGLADKITRILEPVVGIGKVRPQVSVVMDWQQVEETLEQYDPNGSVIRSQQRMTERSPGAGGGAAIGVPGPLGEAFDAPSADAGASEFLTQDEVINYEVSKSVRHVVDPVGEIERMSVAVIIDDRTEISVDEEGVAALVSEPWSSEEMERYRNLVAATVGVDPVRGDTLIVENVSFGNDALPIEPPTMIERQAPLILNALRYLMVPVIFVLVYLLFLRPVQKTIFAKWEPSVRSQLAAASFGAGGMQTPMSVSQLESALQTAQLPALPGQGTPPQSEQQHKAEREFLPLPDSSKVDLIRNRIIEHAKREPETVARLVRVWLNEDKG